jgi:5,6-dimethylbenzimidazole synthase
MLPSFSHDHGRARIEASMQFDDAFRGQLRDLLIWRRDVRHFRTDPLPAGAVERLIELACLAHRSD